MITYPSCSDFNNLFKENKQPLDEILSSIKETLIDSTREIIQFKSFEEQHSDHSPQFSNHSSNSSEVKTVAQMTISFFYSTKQLLESKSGGYKEKSLTLINNLLSNPRNSSYEILSPYLYHLLVIDNTNIDAYPNISSFRSKHNQNPLTYLNEVSFNSNNDSDTFSSNEKLMYYYINPNAFIHFIELQIELNNTRTLPQNKLVLINRLINFIIGFYSFTSYYPPLNHYNEIINTILKALIAFSIEIIVKNFSILPQESIQELFISYLKISFELEVNSNEIYLFSLLSLLILYINCDYITIAKFNLLLNSPCSNHILKHCISMINDTIKHINSGSIVALHIVLIKLIEYILMEKQSKDLMKIEASIRLVNVSDFIMSDYAFHPSVYDLFDRAIKNFKEKMYWNFSELCFDVYMKRLKYPKIHKKTMMRYLCYEPDCKTLLYNLVQYYYANKNFRKTKILIKKILSSVSMSNENQVDFDIETNSLFIQSHIYLNENKYDEAKDLCILNLKRLEKSSNQSFLSRCYAFLGFSYSKLGQKAYNLDERVHNNTMALKYFEQAQKISKTNLTFVFYVAHQLYDLKRYEECLKFLSECDVMSTIHLAQLRVILHITMMEYDSALNVCKNIFKTNDQSNAYFNTTYLLKFYIQIYFQINYSMEKEEEDKLLQSIKVAIEKIYDGLVAQINALSELLKQPIESKRVGDAFEEIKTVIRYDTKDISEKQFQESQSRVKHDIRRLEGVKTEVIKDFYLLANYMRDNGIDERGSILSCLKDKVVVKGVSSEDINNLLISAIQSKYAGSNSETETEKLLKRILEINPTHMVALKLFVAFLIKQRKDYSNAYVYCIKAIKIDDKEIGLWELLSQYYFNLNDKTKYYECMMKEIENSKYHTNAFLIGLLPKVIL